MTAAVFDTNIVIDLLDDDRRASDAIAAFDQSAISVVTWMEVMVGTGGEDGTLTRDVLATFDRFAIDDAIMERAVVLRVPGASN